MIGKGYKQLKNRLKAHPSSISFRRATSIQEPFGLRLHAANYYRIKDLSVVFLVFFFLKKNKTKLLLADCRRRKKHSGSVCHLFSDR